MRDHGEGGGDGERRRRKQLRDDGEKDKGMYTRIKDRVFLRQYISTFAAHLRTILFANIGNACHLVAAFCLSIQNSPINFVLLGGNEKL